MIVAGEHVCTVEDLVTDRRLHVHVARVRPYADASLDVTEELKEMIARIHGEGELRMADVISIGQLDDGSYNVLVEWVRLAEALRYEDLSEFSVR